MSMPLTVSHRNGNTLFYFEQVSSNTLLNSFSCSVIEYNDYLFEDALRSQSYHIAVTWLLKERATDDIAAYISPIADVIKLSVSEKEAHNLQYPFKTIPAMKIAKLAVSHPAQSKYKKLGTYMISKAMSLARICNRQLFSFSFLTVDADIEHNGTVIEFYHKYGFVPNAEMNAKRNKTISMRKDILAYLAIPHPTI